MKLKNTYMPFIISIILIIGILIGYWFGSTFNHGDQIIPSLRKSQEPIGMIKGKTSFSLLPRANKISSLLGYIEKEYVDTVNIELLTEKTIPYLLENLDPHSIYISAKDLRKYNEPIVGNFSGIGIQFNMNDDTVAVINTIPNGPSEIVGILPGDRIIKVNEELVSGINMETDSVVSKLRGPKGTLVRVSILRKGEDKLIDFEIKRDDIPLYSVDVAYMINEETGYIKISSFSQTTFNEFVQSVEDLHAKGMNKMILDLRSNGGGIMDAATKIADQFLDSNKLIVYTQGRSRARYDVYSSPNGICQNDSVIILIDEFSASASEILAGAIQDNDRGTIMGRRSFGKGLVQEQVQFSDGSALRLTIARYYTPTGRSIQKPYLNGGREQYYEDINERFIHGEFENVDSIKLIDSLKFVTPKGKIVYGGGGIMPDVFIPLDTTGISNYYTTVRNLGLIYRFAFEFTDNNRNKLKDLKSPEEISAYLDKTNFYQSFIQYADKNEVKPDYKDLRISENLIKTQLKAYIARNLIDNEGFYPIIQEIDNTLFQAIRLFQN